MINKLKSFSPWMLGAPLYMPGNRRDLIEIANGEKFPMLRSMIFCTEDAVSDSELESCIRHLGLCLQGFHDSSHRFRFIRARSPEVLARLLDFSAIEKIDGFVLPKFTEDVFDAYFDLLKGTSFKVMPTLETKEVFDFNAMSALRQGLLQAEIAERIIMLRIGGNDLMNLLGIRRTRHSTIYESPIGHIIAQLLTIFRPYGFSLAAPVFEYLDDTQTLQKEMRQDLAYGLIGKTAIHPTQIPIIEAAYAVDKEDYEMAFSLNDTESPAVFRMHNAMCEVATHQQWATNIINRHRCYGIKEPLMVKGCAESSF